jgi:hypothetical protein
MNTIAKYSPADRTLKTDAGDEGAGLFNRQPRGLTKNQVLVWEQLT